MHDKHSTHPLTEKKKAYVHRQQLACAAIASRAMKPVNLGRDASRVQKENEREKKAPVGPTHVLAV